MIKKSTLKLLVMILSCSLILINVSGCRKEEDKRVLLISIDGLRSDAVENTEYGKYLLKNSTYSLEVTAVNPTITLPNHMSMFHSVLPDEHKVKSNTYEPSKSLGAGINEVVFNRGKTAALFYNWENIKYVATKGTTEISKYISGEDNGWEQSNTLIGEACIEYITSTPTDFAFLYLGFLDEQGHNYGWLSQEYYYALNESFSLVESVIDAAFKQNYTVIITSDHGGHDYSHSAGTIQDTIIPLFIIGKGFKKGNNIGPISILDVAPTVIDILNMTPPAYWKGKAIKS